MVTPVKGPKEVGGLRIGFFSWGFSMLGVFGGSKFFLFEGGLFIFWWFLEESKGFFGCCERGLLLSGCTNCPSPNARMSFE